MSIKIELNKQYLCRDGISVRTIVKYANNKYYCNKGEPYAENGRIIASQYKDPCIGHLLDLTQMIPTTPDDIKVKCPVCKNRFSIEDNNECPYCEAKEQMQIHTVICGKCFYSYDKQIHITCPDCGSKDRLEQMPKLETSTTPCSDEYFVNQITNVLRSDNQDQRDITRVGLQLICKLLDKNADYSSAAFKSPCLTPGIPAGTAIEVRMSDKLERIFNLLKGNSPKVAESLEDTFDDLLGYLVLRKIAKQRAAQ